VFAGGFVSRPVGALLLGMIGDRWGTAASLRVAILLMTVTLAQRNPEIATYHPLTLILRTPILLMAVTLAHFQQSLSSASYLPPPRTPARLRGGGFPGVVVRWP
jgi:MFS family permease